MLDLVRKKTADSLRLLTAVAVGDQLPGVRAAKGVAVRVADLLAPLESASVRPTPAPPSAAPTAPTSTEPEMELWVDDLRSQIATGHDYLIVDIRDPQEWHEGVIPDSLLIPSFELLQRIGELRDQDRPVVVVCADGSMSRGAAINLRDRGCSSVHYLRGGLWGWHRAGGGIRPGPRRSNAQDQADGMDG